ncbi:MAG: FHA domain-containing protein [Myxococcales bacterium]
MKLIIEDEEGRKTVVPFVREEISIGRQEGNTIRLTERNVSRKHARLLRKNGSVLVEDLGSFNGVRVNGDRIEGRLSVQEGDLIEIGDYDLAIESEATDAAATPTPGRTDGRGATEPMGGGHAATPVSGRAPTVPDPTVPEEGEARHQATAVIRPEALAEQVRDVRDLAPGERPKIVIVSGDQAGQTVAIERTEFRIGRTSGDNDLAINHRSISRNHAKIVGDASGAWRILDLQSANGVRVNGEDYADAPIAPGDILELGHVRLRFVGPGESYKYVPEEERTPTPIAKPSQLPGTSRPLALYGAIGAGALAVLGAGGYLLFGGKPAKKEPAPFPDELAVAQRPHPPPAAPAVPKPPPQAPPPVVAAAPPAAEEAPAPRTPQSNRRQILELIAQAKASLKARDVGAAEEKLRAAQDLSPDDATVARLEKEIEIAKKREAKQKRRPQVAQASAPEEAPTEAAPAPSRADRKARALQLYQDAVGSMGGGDYAGAVGKLQKALGSEPNMAEAHKALGICFAKLREFDKGAAHYEQYLKLKPNASDAPQVRKMLADYYKSKGEQ